MIPTLWWHIFIMFSAWRYLLYLAAVYYWLPKWCGNMYDERLGKAHFDLSFVG